MEKQSKSKFVQGKKHKRPSTVLITASDPKNVKLAEVEQKIDTDIPDSSLKNILIKQKKTNSVPSSPNKRKKINKTKSAVVKPTETDTVETVPKVRQAATIQQNLTSNILPEAKSQDIYVKYPVLKDKDLIDRFLKVPFSNNQKGRIRQALKLTLQNSDNTISPDVINGRIQAMLGKNVDLTDSDLRRIRILHNMLKSSLEIDGKQNSEQKKTVKKKEKDVNGDKKQAKVKGPKRYVVFMGNLPLDVTEEMIMNHFSEMNEQIKNIRIPKLTAEKKSAIAFLEVSNEPSFELALSKHHSMMGKKRINILYTTQKKSKITKTEAKAKSAKLIAMQKAGKLTGSIPMVKKRSHRRTIAKKAKATAEIA